MAVLDGTHRRISVNLKASSAGASPAIARVSGVSGDQQQSAVIRTGPGLRWTLIGVGSSQ